MTCAGTLVSFWKVGSHTYRHEGAAAEVDRALRALFAGGFRQVLVRGGTDFTQTKHLDRWDDDPHFSAHGHPKL